MNRTVKLGYSEAAAMVLVLMGAKAYLGYPRMMAELGATAGWLIVLLGGGMSVVLWLVLAALLSRFPGKSIMDIAVTVLGPIAGLAFNLLFFIYLLASTSILLRLFSEAVILTALPEVPISAISFLYLFPIFIAAYLGLEAISRSAFISVPFILFGTLAVVISMYPYWDTKQLLPILGTGYLSIAKDSLLNVSAFGEVSVLVILVPYFSFDAKMIKKVGLFCIAIVTFSFIIITVIYLMAFPMPGALENLAPFYQMSRTIYLGRFFQRFESIFILFWTFTAFLRLSIGVMVSAKVLQHTLKLPYYRPLLPALAVLLYALALTPSDLLSAVKFDNMLRHDYGWLMTFALPIFVGIIAFWKKKGNVHAQEKKNG
jgi:spore germination protein (amino acid permease)